MSPERPGEAPKKCVEEQVAVEPKRQLSANVNRKLLQQKDQSKPRAPSSTTAEGASQPLRTKQPSIAPRAEPSPSRLQASPPLAQSPSAPATKEKEKKDDLLSQEQRVALKLAELSKPTLVAIAPSAPSVVPPISKNLLRLHNMYSKRLQSSINQSQLANPGRNPHLNNTLGLDFRRRQSTHKK